ADGLGPLHERLAAGRDALARATDWVVATMPEGAAAAAAGSALFLTLAGLVAGGWVTARAALGARGAAGAARWLDAKAVTARHYADHLLAQGPALLAAIEAGGSTVMALAEDQF